KIADCGSPSARYRDDVVVLDRAPCLATMSRVAHERALILVAITHRALHVPRDVTRAPRRTGLGLGPVGGSELLLLLPRDQEIERLLGEGADISGRNLMGHALLCPPQLVTQALPHAEVQGEPLGGNWSNSRRGDLPRGKCCGRRHGRTR